MKALAFAFGAGLLAPVNPCGFAMLPAFLGYYLGEGDRASPLARLTQGFAVGGAVSLGFVGVFALAAALVSLGLRSLVRYVPWAAAAIALVLVGLGVAMLAGRKVALRPMAGLRPAEGRGYLRMAVFGAAYATASLSCSLAILFVVVSQALAMANPAGVLGVLAAYGAGAATLLTGLALSTALARGALARRVRRVLPLASRLGGLLVVASGLYLLAYWVPVLAGSSESPVTRGPVGAFAESLAGRLGDLLENGRGALALLAPLFVVGGFWVALRGRRAQPGGTPAACCEAQEKRIDEPITLSRTGR